MGYVLFMNDATTTQTFKQFAEKHRLTMTTKFVGSRREEGWEHLAFEVSISVAGKDMHPFVVPYRVGTHYALPEEWKGGKKQPRRPDPSKSLRIEDVLCSLATDAQAIHYSDFEAWAQEHGYSTDSRKAEKLYRACCETASKLISLFGHIAMPGGLALLDELLSCTEE